MGFKKFSRFDIANLFFKMASDDILNTLEKPGRKLDIFPIKPIIGFTLDELVQCYFYGREMFEEANKRLKLNPPKVNGEQVAKLKEVEEMLKKRLIEGIISVKDKRAPSWVGKDLWERKREEPSREKPSDNDKYEWYFIYDIYEKSITSALLPSFMEAKETKKFFIQLGLFSNIVHEILSKIDGKKDFSFHNLSDVIEIKRYIYEGGNEKDLEIIYENMYKIIGIQPDSPPPERAKKFLRACGKYVESLNDNEIERSKMDDKARLTAIYDAISRIESRIHLKLKEFKDKRFP